MATRILRPISGGNGSTVFADPNNILNTTRFKSDAFLRKVGNIDYPAVRLEVISARVTPLVVGEASLPTSSNVRISVSGLSASAVVIKQQLADAYANAIIAIDTDAALSGFPVNPHTEYKIDSVAV